MTAACLFSDSFQGGLALLDRFFHAGQIIRGGLRRGAGFRQQTICRFDLFLNLDQTGFAARQFGLKLGGLVAQGLSGLFELIDGLVGGLLIGARLGVERLLRGDFFV